MVADLSGAPSMPLEHRRVLFGGGRLPSPAVVGLAAAAGGLVTLREAVLDEIERAERLVASALCRAGVGGWAPAVEYGQFLDLSDRGVR